MVADGHSHETGAPPDFGMTDLEEALRGPEGEQVRHAAIAQMDGLIQKIEDHLSIGADPRQIETINCVRRSLAVARTIVISAPR